jgi:hypothetical protein
MWAKSLKTLGVLVRVFWGDRVAPDASYNSMQIK